MVLRYFPPLNEAGIGENLMAELIAFKTAARKDDPARRPGLHGPYEELTRTRTGRLPDDYYDHAEAAPWGLRIEESRSNLLWQALSGLLDRHPDFAAAYMALALDKALSEDDYAKELKTLHGDWAAFLTHSGLVRDHHHSHMRTAYQSVACAACSVLTATAIRDPGMNALFREEILPLPPQDRHYFLRQRGLAPLLNRIIPDQSPAPANI